MFADVFGAVGRYGDDIDRRALFRWDKSEFLRVFLDYELTGQRAFLRKQRPDIRVAINTLAENLDLLEKMFELSPELIEIVFVHMVRIVEMVMIRIKLQVRCGYENKNNGRV